MKMPYAWTGVLLLVAVAAPARDLPRRPFVLVTAEELSTLRGEVSRPGWKANLYRQSRGIEISDSGRGIRSNADLWLKRKIQIPPRGGHYHLFFCDDGNRLNLPKDHKFVPGPYRCPKCGKTYSGEKYEAALRCAVHHWLSLAVRDLALVGELEHKPEYTRKAADILLKYAEAYPGPHTNALNGGMLFQSLNEAMWVIPLAQSFDLIHDDLTPVEQKKIAQFLQTVAEGIRACGVFGNWGSWHLSSVGIVGYAIGNDELIDWATDQFKKQIRDDLGDDGLWPESVHTYHYFPLDAFMQFAEAAWNAGDDLYHWEGKPGKSLLTMFTAPLAYAYPDLRLPAINDGWFQAFVPPDMYEVVYYRTKDPQFAWVLANGYKPGAMPAGSTAFDPRSTARGGLHAFLIGREIPSEVEAPPAKSINFPVLGIAVLRSTNGAMMTFDYGPFLGHGHRDKMGVTLFANDKLWAADYGTPGYGAGILSWYQSTFSHNTIIVDDKPQVPTKENGADLWLGGGSFEAVRSTTCQACEGVTHSRSVIRVDDCFVIYDELSSPTNHAYDFYFHSEGKFALDDPGKSSSAKPAVPWITDLKQQPARRVISCRWADAGKGLAMTLIGGSQVTPLVGRSPAETGLRKVALLIARQTGSNARFITVLEPYVLHPRITAELRDEKLIIRRGATEQWLTLPAGESQPVIEQKGL